MDAFKVECEADVPSGRKGSVTKPKTSPPPPPPQLSNMSGAMAMKSARDWLDRVRLYAAERPLSGLQFAKLMSMPLVAAAAEGTEISGDCLPASLERPDWFDYVQFTYGQRLIRKNLPPILAAQLMGLALFMRQKTARDALLIEETIPADMNTPQPLASEDQKDENENPAAAVDPEVTRNGKEVQEQDPKGTDKRVATTSDKDKAELKRIEKMRTEERKKAKKEKKRLAKVAARRALRMLAIASKSWYSFPIFPRQGDSGEPSADESKPRPEPTDQDTQKKEGEEEKEEEKLSEAIKTVYKARQEFVRLCRTLNEDIDDKEAIAAGNIPPIKMNQMDLVLLQFALAGLWISFSDRCGLKGLDKSELRALLHVIRVLGWAHGLDDEFNIVPADQSLETTQARCRSILHDHFLPMLATPLVGREEATNEITEESSNVKTLKIDGSRGSKHAKTPKELIQKPLDSPEWLLGATLLKEASRALPEFQWKPLVHFWLTNANVEVHLDGLGEKVRARLLAILLGHWTQIPSASRRLHRRSQRALDRWSRSKKKRTRKSTKEDMNEDKETICDQRSEYSEGPMGSSRVQLEVIS